MCLLGFVSELLSVVDNRLFEIVLLERVAGTIDAKQDRFSTLTLDCLHQWRLSPVIVQVFFNIVLA